MLGSLTRVESNELGEKLYLATRLSCPDWHLMLRQRYISVPDIKLQCFIR